jgi:tetratricopeptide (TPR) repeat protein
MSFRVTRALIVVAASLTCLGGCGSSTKLSDLWTSKTSDAPKTADASDTPAADTPATDAGFKLNDLWAPRSADGTNWITGKPDSKSADTTGSVAITPAEPGPSGEPVKPGAKPGLLGDDPHDDLQAAKKYFRSNNYGLAERAFRTAVEQHPRDAEAWIGLAASYDRLHRFDLADRAYQEATRIVGPTVEILNNQGFSYMLRGDYARAHKKLEEAAAKDPANPYVAANLRLLQESYREGKSIQ